MTHEDAQFAFDASSHSKLRVIEVFQDYAVSQSVASTNDYFTARVIDDHIVDCECHSSLEEAVAWIMGRIACHVD